MKRWEKGLGLLTSFMLMFSMTAGTVRAAVYDSTWAMGEAAVLTDDPAQMSYLYPGDSVANTQLFLGDEPLEPGILDDGMTPGWTNRSGKVYQITVQSDAIQIPAVDPETGEPILDENGEQVFEDSTEANVSYRLDTIGGVVAVADGTMEAGSPSDLYYSLPDDAVFSYTDADGNPAQIWSSQMTVQAYRLGTLVTLNAADKAAEGKQFQKWSVNKMEGDSLTPISEDMLSADPNLVPGLTPDMLTQPQMSYTAAGTEALILFLPVYTAAAEAAPATDAEPNDAQQAGTPQYDPATGLEIDPATGLLIDPNTGDLLDPATLQPVVPGSGSTPAAPGTDSAPAAEQTTPSDTQEMVGVADASPAGSILGNANEDEIKILNTDTNYTDQPQEGQNQAEPALNTVEEKTYSLALTYATSDPAEVYALAEGTAITVTANDRQEEGLEFDRWSTADLTLTEEQLTQPSIQFPMPAANASLTAEYKEKEAPQPVYYTLTLENAASEVDGNALTAGMEFDVTAFDKEAENQIFTGWSAEGIELSEEQKTQQTVHIVMPEANVTLKAQYAEKVVTETLTAVNATINNVESADNGDGSVSAEVEDGSTVTVTANAAPEGMKFEQWNVTSQGEVQTSSVTEPTLEVTLSAADATVEPVFTAQEVKEPAITVTVTPEGSGTVVQSGKEDTGTAVKYKYTLTPAAGYQADSFTVKVGEADPQASADKQTIEFTAEKKETAVPVAIAAQLSPVTYSLTVNAGTAGKTTLTEGEKTQITADAPQAGYRFANWTLDSGDGSGTIETATASPTNFTMAATNATVTANYEKIPFTLTVTSGSGTGTHYINDTVVITADPPQEGYRFRSWTVTSGSGTIASTSMAQTTFTMAASDAAVTANYELIPYTLTVKNGSGSGSFTMGTSTAITPHFPASGKEFDQWEKTSGKIGIDSVHNYYATVTMRANDATVTARYKDGPNPNNNTITGLENGAEYLKGTTLTFTAVGAGMNNQDPNPGDYRYRPASYQIGSVGGSWTASPYTTSMAINAVGDYTLTVTYAKDVFDGDKWKADGTTVTKSITFHVVNALSVKTGDNSPLIPLIIAGCAALAVIILLVIILAKRRKK